MFTKRTVAKTKLDEAITEALSELKGWDANTSDYEKIVDQLTKLYTMKADETPNRISKDTLALIAGNLAGIVLIVSYERAHVITSKALSFAGKLK